MRAAVFDDAYRPREDTGVGASDPDAHPFSVLRQHVKVLGKDAVVAQVVVGGGQVVEAQRDREPRSRWAFLLSVHVGSRVVLGLLLAGGFSGGRSGRLLCDQFSQILL